MLKFKNHNYKRLPATCLLAVYLFFSFIPIAGYRTGADSFFRQNMQTAVVCSAESSINEETVSYKKNSPPAKKIIPDDLKCHVITLLGHNRLAKVKFNCLSKKLNLILTPIRIVQIRCIPKNSGESRFSSFTA